MYLEDAASMNTFSYLWDMVLCRYFSPPKKKKNNFLKNLFFWCLREKRLSFSSLNSSLPLISLNSAVLVQSGAPKSIKIEMKSSSVLIGPSLEIQPCCSFSHRSHMDSQAVGIQLPLCNTWLIHWTDEEDFSLWDWQAFLCDLLHSHEKRAWVKVTALIQISSSKWAGIGRQWF